MWFGPFFGSVLAWWTFSSGFFSSFWWKWWQGYILRSLSEVTEVKTTGWNVTLWERMFPSSGCDRQVDLLWFPVGRGTNTDGTIWMMRAVYLYSSWPGYQPESDCLHKHTHTQTFSCPTTPLPKPPCVSWVGWLRFMHLFWTRLPSHFLQSWAFFKPTKSLR